MRKLLPIAILASAVATPALAKDDPSRGLASVNVPVVTRADYVFDAAAPGGSLPPSEMARLDAWFAGLNLGYGDMVTVDGPNAAAARSDVARLAGRYAMLVSQSPPVTQGAIPSDAVRVIVTRTRATVPGCPNWSVPSQPNYANKTMPNFGCAVNGNMAAMVANPNDLVYGRADLPGSDGFAGTKAITLYRSWELTGVIDGQTRRPLIKPQTKSGGDE
jgi:pilus assembly protein CpaD